MAGYTPTVNYSFSVHYRPGILNILPDALSCLFPARMQRQQIPSTKDQAIALAYMHILQNEETERQLVPEDQRQELLYTVHAMGHLGANAMVAAIHRQEKTWPKLANDCLDFVKRCRECQRINIARKGYHPMKAIHAQLPGEHIAIDLAGPFKESEDRNVYLLVIVDVCTRFVLLDALPNKSA